MDGIPTDVGEGVTGTTVGVYVNTGVDPEAGVFVTVGEGFCVIHAVGVQEPDADGVEVKVG